MEQDKQNNNKKDTNKVVVDNSSMTSSVFGEEFIFDDLILELTETDPKTKSQTTLDPSAYAESLGARLERRMKGMTFHETVEELKASDTEVTVELVNKVDSVESLRKVFDSLEIVGKAKIANEYGIYEVPIPASSQLEQYSKIATVSVTKAFQRILDTHNLMSNKRLDLNSLKNKMLSVAANSVQRVKCKVTKKEVLRDILTVLMVERMSSHYFERLVAEYQHTEIWRDPLSEGLWVIDPPPSHPAVTAARKRKVVPKYNLDDNKIQLLKAIVFSGDTREVAGAKLTLNATLPRHIMEDIMSNPGTVLAYALAEVGLSVHEVLSILFREKKGHEPKCPRCSIHVDIEGVLYHVKCVVVEWLIHNYFVKYDDKSGMLIVQPLVYLDQTQRAIFDIINTRMSLLAGPFRYERSGEYSKIAIHHGKMQKEHHLTVNPASVVGSSEWLEKIRNQRRAEKNY